MKKPKRYQILRRERGAEKWEFVAHGARFDEAQAREMERLIKSHGSRVRLLPL